ncbi:MAG: polysaccharide biosynthesis protein [Spirochaetales bacterium]|nr:polysaccharide biosynthesis protein [Spirochaetales bacterium]
MNTENNNKRTGIRWALVFYDSIITIGIEILFLLFYGGSKLDLMSFITHGVVELFAIIGVRFAFNIYRTIWRYGGIQNYMKMMISDGVAFIIYLLFCRFIIPVDRISVVTMVAMSSMILLGSLVIRMTYRYAFKCGNKDTPFGRFLLWLLSTFGRINVTRFQERRRIKVAILGAGNLGNTLYAEIGMDNMSPYEVRCFIDSDKEKVGRYINGCIVLDENTFIPENLILDYNVQEVFFAVHNYPQDKMRAIYEKLSKAGIKVKNYDIPHMTSGGEKPQLKEFEIEDLLFRRQESIINEKINAYYRGKTVLITGGGGSIGSELCRQIARMTPKKIIILDIYENSAYDIQQELKMKYGNKLDLSVEIVSITNKKGLGRVFETYSPDIVINAAAHKHVPLMEHNCIEAVENNVFGCLNIIELCEEYGVSRFMMVSTDKAVNPTNVMGATKRMCEMIMLAYSTRGKVKCSATRFGNVLGSAGSVIPLFKRQIAAGGPVTITDKRIIRYFMTISEASQLVLESGAMAENGEIFVLDMGNPVKILDLAENMISLMGARNIDIIETGLRPGEKLYEELLVNKKELDKTENDLIFIDRESPITMEDLEYKLSILSEATASLDDDGVREALRKVVPTFKRPEEVNNA